MELEVSVLNCQCNMENVYNELQCSQVIDLFESLAPKERLIDYYRLPKGHRNQNYLLSTNHGKFLMRVRKDFLEFGNVVVEKAVFSKLDKGIRHPERLCSCKNEGLECTLYDFVEGKELSEILPNMAQRTAEELFFNLGKKLAIIHKTKSFTQSGSLDEGLEVKEALPLLSEWLSEFNTPILSEWLGEELLNRVNYLLIRRHKELEEMDKDICLIHGDCNGDNILVGQGMLTFLDWEFVSAGHRYSDIGQLFRGVSESEGKQTAFYNGYKEVLPQALDPDWWMLSKLRDLLSIVQLISREETKGAYLAMLESYFIHTLNLIDR